MAFHAVRERNPLLIIEFVSESRTADFVKLSGDRNRALPSSFLHFGGGRVVEVLGSECGVKRVLVVSSSFSVTVDAT